MPRKTSFPLLSYTFLEFIYIFKPFFKKQRKKKLTARTWKTAISSWYGLKDNLNISAAGIRYLICMVRWSIINIELVEITNSIGTNWKKKRKSYVFHYPNRELGRWKGRKKAAHSCGTIIELQAQLLTLPPVRVILLIISAKTTYWSLVATQIFFHWGFCLSRT